jgi:chemotaxis protein methyltransferase CheR
METDLTEMMSVIESDELKKMLEAVRSVYGYDFTDYAEVSVKRRVTGFMNNRKLTSIDTLQRMLLNDDNLFEEFIREISVTVTEMFRDPTFYRALREKVVNRLKTYPFIKIWMAGCATGEEVYSLSILLKEEGILNRSVIYATDINQRSLQIAREGIYPLDYMKNYTSSYQQSGGKVNFSDYYTAKYGSALFDQSLRENVVFSSHNLATDKSFNEFHMIICRNVLIYFNQQLQSRVIGLFHDSLCSFGFLGLGNKESLLFAANQKDFVDIDRKEKIFMKS